ncbi:MAG TPA: SAM-dependent chlorinase/fluorinase [Bryobacteraceae bacterium]|jgi:S-adenosylmethionine hydrolase|nr:SAM-dependent chlorinase/fluorinase [Bryobacteraceae bacterium]
MPHRIVTLTTDFGLSDHFVGTMKGVILGICPTARIVDISHEITPFEIPEGAFVVAQAYRYFPPKTVHVVVVDPGVGTSRRPILAEAGGQYFIAPDNGVLSLVWAREEKARVRAITAKRYFLPDVSQTFHGRDVFAPSAAHLAKGVPAARFGKLIEDHLRLSFAAPVRTGRRAWSGVILKIDRFGNLITNFRPDDFPELAARPFEFAVGFQKVSRLAANYAECAPGELFVILGSSGYLEISTSQASAAKALGCGAGAPVELTLF